MKKRGSIFTLYIMSNVQNLGLVFLCRWGVLFFIFDVFLFLFFVWNCGGIGIGIGIGIGSCFCIGSWCPSRLLGQFKESYAFGRIFSIQFKISLGFIALLISKTVWHCIAMWVASFLCGLCKCIQYE